MSLSIEYANSTTRPIVRTRFVHGRSLVVVRRPLARHQAASSFEAPGNLRPESRGTIRLPAGSFIRAERPPKPTGRAALLSLHALRARLCAEGALGSERLPGWGAAAVLLCVTWADLGLLPWGGVETFGWAGMGVVGSRDGLVWGGDCRTELGA